MERWNCMHDAIFLTKVHITLVVELDKSHLLNILDNVFTQTK